MKKEEQQKRDTIILAESILRSFTPGFFGLYVMIEYLTPKQGAAALYIRTLPLILAFCFGLSYIILYFTKFAKSGLFPKRLIFAPILCCFLVIGYAHFAVNYYLPDIIHGTDKTATKYYIVYKDHSIAFNDDRTNLFHHSKITKNTARSLVAENPQAPDSDLESIRTYYVEFEYYPKTDIIKSVKIIK